MRKIVIMAAMLSAIASLVFASYGAETIITTGGSVLTGVIESGLPATVSVTSNTDDVFTVQRANMKHVRFDDHREVTVETFDGNIIVGTLGGISDVFGLRTQGGDVQSLSVDSIVEIRFDPPEPPEDTLTQPTYPVDSSSADLMVRTVVEAYDTRSGSFTLGVDSGLQLGFSMKNGFEIPRFTIGVNGILLGAVWRVYFPPSLARVERTAERLASEGIDNIETLLEETRIEETPSLLPYIQLGTDAFIIPHIGGGLIFRLGQMLYFDLGATLDTMGIPWPSIGVLIYF
ncbi:hypothetical protein ACFLSZ_02870 [Candidatus Bipolaricaulota bacterium]